VSQPAADTRAEPLVIGRYALFDELAAGGMATVHLGRLLGPSGFGRTVAIKRLHSHFLKDQEFITMFMDEARIVARIRHPNVVPMVDVVQSDKGLFLVMEYVHGETLSKLMRASRASREKISPKIVTAVLHGALLGLHSAHETRNAAGALLNVVHRDVSPQNIMVGLDGVARMLDFGIAKAAGRAQVTREGQIKGKLAYMAPEQIRGQVDRRSDVFAASVVLWEALAGRRLHEGSKDVEIVTRVVQGKFPKPSEFTELPEGLDEIVLRGLAVDTKKRYASARDMALDLEQKVGLATASEVTAWVERLAEKDLETRSQKIAAMESVSADLVGHESNPPPPIVAFSEPGVESPAIRVDLEAASSGQPLAPDLLTGTQTPAGTALPSRPSKAPSDLRPYFVLLAMCVVLAFIGASLGGYALYRRSASAQAAKVEPPSAPPEPALLGSVDEPREAEPRDDAAETSLGDASP
jgi:eukaryotic-like serine/threonine-protein kinase